MGLSLGRTTSEKVIGFVALAVVGLVVVPGVVYMAVNKPPSSETVSTPGAGSGQSMAGVSPDANDPRVSREQFGAEWPFTVAEGKVDCNPVLRAGRQMEGLTFEATGHPSVALNGVAIQENFGEDAATSRIYVKGRNLAALQQRARDYCRAKYPQLYK